MTLIVYLAIVVSCTLIFVQLTTILLAIVRMRQKYQSSVTHLSPHITLIRPLCGLDHDTEELLLTCFQQNYPHYDILFCVASQQDPIIPHVYRMIEDHPHIKAKLLIGDDVISQNPKLNNMVKAWRESDAQWLAMADSNLLLPADYLSTLMNTFIQKNNTGLVSSPAIGIRPANLWGSLEAAILNSHQARWQFFAAAIGLDFAQGKTLFWRRDIVDLHGGLNQLGTEVAEDVASTKLVHRLGLKVRLTPHPFAQPIGQRTFRSVWDRQLRWARIRRVGFLWLFLPEILLGSVPVLISTIYLASIRIIPSFMPLLVFIVWYGLEWGMAKKQQWPHALRDIVAMIMRDMLLPMLWIWCWAGKNFVWRGNAMTTQNSAHVQPHENVEN
ncbi:MAG: ceramide glucosyltransferase [Acinetobacter sp.]